MEFFEPAPLHRPGELDARVERRYRRIQTAGSQLQRLAAVCIALLWPVSVLAAPYRWSPLTQVPDLSSTSPLRWVFVLFTSCSVLLIVAAIKHRWSWYLVTFRLSAAIYLGVLTVHVLAVVSTGESPLTDVHLFDYPIAPMGLLLFAAPRRVSFPLSVGVLLIVSLVNQGWPLTSASIVESLWSGILVIPFLLLFGSVIDSVQEVDRAASALRRQVVKTAGSRVLREAEVHFMGFLHDQVLQHLSGVRRSLVAPVVPDYDFERSQLEVNSRSKMVERSLPKALAELKEALQSVAPDAELSIPEQIVTRSSIPTLTMNVLSDAAIEALGNSVRHAPDAQRTVEFEVEWAPDGQCLSLVITISDDGPGFEMANIGEDRAGLRISVLGRMRTSPGCDVDLMTVPGEGASVRLMWLRSDCEQPEIFAMPSSWLSERLSGLGRVFTPAFGIFTVIAVTAMGLLQDHPQYSFLFGAAAAMVIPVMWGLSRGSSNRLSGRPTTMVAIGLLGFVTLASAEQVTITEAWPGLWFTGPFALMCAYLVIRDRAGVAWGTFGLGLLPFLAFGFTGPTPDLVGAELMSMVVLMVTGSGFPILFRRVLRSLSRGLRVDTTAATDLALAASQRGYLRDSGAWLRRQLEMVLNPATPVDRRRLNAGLLELRLRDAIRSPGFDVPETSHAVWLAREAGVKVTLRDDRRDDDGEDPDPDPVAHAKFHRALQESLTMATSHPESAMVNARLLPAGRNRYGTIVVGAGEQNQQVLVSRDPADHPAPAGHAVSRAPVAPQPGQEWSGKSSLTGDSLRGEMVNSHDVNQRPRAARTFLRDLPDDFFSHAPLRRTGELCVGVDQTAGLRLLRLVAGFFALIWPPLVLAAWFRWAPDGATPDPTADQLWFLVFGAFTACSVLLVIAAVRHRRRWYMTTFRISGYLYLLLFSSHLAILLGTGQSPLTDLHLADYSLIPTGLLMLTLPRKVGFPLVIGVKAVGSLTNQGLPMTATNIGEALWAGLLALPYLILAVAVLDRIAEIDLAATAQRRRVFKAAGSRLLRDSETRFRGFLHDQVLQHLAGIRGGVIDPVPPEVDLTRSVAALGQPLDLPDVPLSGAIEELERIVERSAPGSQLELPAEVPSGAQLPSVPAGVVGDAVGEALGNSVRHAPSANRAVRLEVDCDSDGSCQRIRVTVTDDGPGFDPAQVGLDRAGLRVSVFGRMEATPGCSADLDTAPGQGTRIDLSWERSLVENPSSSRPRRRWLEEKLEGLGRVFHPAYGIFAVITVGWMGLLQAHPERPALFVLALAALLPVMWGLSRGVDNRLAALPTAVVAVAVVAFSGLAAAEQLVHGDDWPGLWFAPPFAMLCAFLAVRDRTLIAWLTFAVGLVPILAFGLTGPTPERLPALLGELAILMLIGSGFPWLLRRTLRSLSVGLRADGEAATDLALAASQRSYLADSAAWLQGQLTAALDPELPAEVRRDNARLLEMRMRDTVRSPGFDVPATNRAVWRARTSDVTVQLRDDRSDHRGEDPDPDSVGSRNFHRQLQVALDAAAAQSGPGTVNARLSPLSRAEYGTIVAGSVGGEQQIVRVPRGQPETSGETD